MIAGFSACDCSKKIVFFDDEARARVLRLRKAGQTPKSWDELYRCDFCGQYWDMTFPGAGNLCSVEPELIRVSEREVRTKYGENVQESRPMTGTVSEARDREAESR